jgi:hypothetical protein
MPCQLGDDFVLSTMGMKKGNLSLLNSSKKTHTCGKNNNTCKLISVFSFQAPQFG